MSRPLSELTTLKVGGPARELLEPQSEAELIDAAITAWREADEPEEVLVLGGGSNLVASDDGFEGTVIRTDGVRGIESVAAGDESARFRIAAGEPWDAVVQFAVDRGLSGITSLSGIPGTAGAAPVQNIGAYGREIADALVAVDFLDHRTGSVTRIEAADLALSYRTSALKRGRRGVVLAIELALVRDRRAPVTYQQLADSLGVPLGSHVPAEVMRDGVLALRGQKGMLLGEGYPDSAGSFFTNPIVDENWARGLPADAPRYPVSADEADIAAPLDEGPRLVAFPDRRDVKLSAAWLIEHAGIGRGYALPGSRAAISPLHTLSITNAGGATAAEVLQLAEFVQARVSADFGINLQPEPVILTGPAESAMLA